MMSMDPLATVGRHCPEAMRKEALGTDQYKQRHCLGNGYKSCVYEALHLKTSTVVAYKIYYKNRIDDVEYQNIRREIEVHAGLSHQNVLALFAAFETSEAVYIILEHCPMGDLFALKRRWGGRMDEKMCVNYVIMPMLSVMQFLHVNANVVHRDIKPENILFTSNMVLKLADFGLCIDMSRERPVTRLGTLDYMAPEVLRCPRQGEDDYCKVKSLYNEKVDCWAMGILAYELLTSRAPFSHNDEAQAVRNIIAARLVFPPESRLSEEAMSFIASALNRDARNRLSISQMIQHPWMIKTYKGRMQNMRNAESTTSTMSKSISTPQLNLLAEEAPKAKPIEAKPTPASAAASPVLGPAPSPVLGPSPLPVLGSTPLVQPVQLNQKRDRGTPVLTPMVRVDTPEPIIDPMAKLLLDHVALQSPNSLRANPAAKSARRKLELTPLSTSGVSEMGEPVQESIKETVGGSSSSSSLLAAQTTSDLSPSKRSISPVPGSGSPMTRTTPTTLPLPSPGANRGTISPVLSQMSRFHPNYFTTTSSPGMSLSLSTPGGTTSGHESEMEPLSLTASLDVSGRATPRPRVLVEAGPKKVRSQSPTPLMPLRARAETGDGSLATNLWTSKRNGSNMVSPYATTNEGSTLPMLSKTSPPPLNPSVIRTKLARHFSIDGSMDPTAPKPVPGRSEQQRSSSINAPIPQHVDRLTSSFRRMFRLGGSTDKKTSIA